MTNGATKRQRPASPPEPPRWIAVAGLVSGALVLLFFMSLVVASTLDAGVPCSSRFLVVVVLALGIGLSFSFIGGTAVARGQLAIGKLKEHPFTVAATGGFAAVVIVLVLGNTYYSGAQNCTDGGSQILLTGKVLEKDGTPIHGAQVTVEGFSFLARSDSAGVFTGELLGVKKPVLLRVRVTHAEFRSDTREFVANADEIPLGDFRLERYGR
jgi:hypothetical protein